MLSGASAFGCIKCHTFNGKRAEGVQGIDMTLMTTRLERDWFHAYVDRPQEIRPGTRMPTAFRDGKSILDDVLDGTARQQIEAMWVYLSDGNKARPPLGLQKQSMLLTATTEPVIYRNFIEGDRCPGNWRGLPRESEPRFRRQRIEVGAGMAGSVHGRRQALDGPRGGL